MDRETHRRFLEYLEAFPYWNAPSAPKLTRDAFAELDAELMALETKGKKVWDEDETRRALALKRRLQRD